MTEDHQSSCKITMSSVLWFTICWYPFFDCFLLSILLKLSPFFSWIMSLVYDANLAEYFVPEATDLLMAASFLLIIHIIDLFRQKSLPKYTTLSPLWRQFKILILVSKEIDAFLFFLDATARHLIEQLHSQRYVPCIGPAHSREWGITIQKIYIGFYFTLLNCLLIMSRRVLEFCKL